MRTMIAGWLMALALLGCGGVEDGGGLGVATDPLCEVSDAPRARGACEWPSNPYTGPLFRGDPDSYAMICAGGTRPDPARGQLFQLDTDVFCVLPGGLPPGTTFTGK